MPTFAYHAQSTDGQTYNGTLDAAGIDQASRQLQALQLRITRLEPAAKPATAGAFRTDDFLAFNQQLAHLTAGGLPIERSLRLMAKEMRKRRQSQAVNQIAAELEKGTPLAAAFAAHQRSFPPLYGMLLDAGVRSNNLPAMLLNLGRHVEMVQRLRAALWRAASYPLMVLLALLLVLSFIWLYIMPEFANMFGPAATTRQMLVGNPSAPGTTSGLDLIFPIASAISFSLMAIIAAFLLAVVSLTIIARSSTGNRLVHRLALPLPLIGPILKWNLLARWCDALHLAVQAGLDLPESLKLAGNAVGSSRLRDDSHLLIEAVSAGRRMDEGDEPRLLPPLVPAALQLGTEQNDLPAAAAMLAKMYQEQAEMRLAVLPQVLSPLLLILTAVCISLAIASALLPLIAVLRALTPH